MQGLMDKYKTENEYLFPIISGEYASGYKQYRLALGRINRHLKKIAVAADIKVALTTYTAKHNELSIWLKIRLLSPISLIVGNTLETSELQYFVFFCISQRTIFQLQIYILLVTKAIFFRINRLKVIPKEEGIECWSAPKS